MTSVKNIVYMTKTGRLLEKEKHMQIAAERMIMKNIKRGRELLNEKNLHLYLLLQI